MKEKVGNVYIYKFFTQNEGCWLISGAAKVMGKGILISSSFFPTASGAFTQSQKSYYLIVPPTPHQQLVQILPSLCASRFTVLLPFLTKTLMLCLQKYHVGCWLSPSLWHLWGHRNGSFHLILSNSQHIFLLVLSQSEPSLCVCNRLSLGIRNIILIPFRM